MIVMPLSSTILVISAISGTSASFLPPGQLGRSQLPGGAIPMVSLRVRTINSDIRIMPLDLHSTLLEISCR
ncbi:hypothetical protein B0I35DRAFT_432594 [Stachybotrys elegans]|uniref:Secreted protein n=1 Tax=Stachybotrys elegans TaxID=80388 RepID=A0A8K0SMJ4_9HYPO|nr:hypothetical protein B0I35DRAFT_432594 [Stachybotrys elegans]